MPIPAPNLPRRVDMRRTRRAGLCIALLTVLCTASVTAATCFATSKRISASATSVCSLADHPLVRRLSWLRLRGGGSASGDGDAAIWSGKSKQYDARNRGAKGEKRAKSEKSEERIESAMDAVSTKSKKKKRRSGIDWETFRRKVPGGAPVDDSPYDPYFEGHDGKVYKMMTHDDKHIRAVPANPPKRGKWRQKEVVKRRVEAILEAARKNRELDSPYVDGPAFGELGLQVLIGPASRCLPARALACGDDASPPGAQADGQPARRHSWERHLFPHLRAAIEAERAGLHFTGRFRFDERGRQMPVCTFPALSRSPGRAAPPRRLSAAPFRRSTPTRTTPSSQSPKPGCNPPPPTLKLSAVQHVRLTRPACAADPLARRARACPHHRRAGAQVLVRPLPVPPAV